MGSSSTLCCSCIQYLCTGIYSHQPFLGIVWTRPTVAARHTYHKTPTSPHGCNWMLVAPPNKTTTIATRNQSQPCMGQQWQKKHFNASHKPLKQQIGENVLVYYPIRKTGLCESFMHRWLVHYTVSARIAPQTYRLRRISNSSETIAHICWIKRILVATLDAGRELSAKDQIIDAPDVVPVRDSNVVAWMRSFHSD